MFDTNNLVDNKALTEQMKILKNGNSLSGSNAFINALLSARFLLPAKISCPLSQVTRPPEVHKAENIQSIVVKKDTVIAYPSYSDTSNNHYMMIFTDWDEIRRWPSFEPDQQTVVLTFFEICKLFAEEPDMYSGFVINPYGRCLVVTRKTISKIRSRLLEAAGIPIRPPKRDSRIFLADLKIFPLDLAVALRSRMRSRSDIMTAYLLLMIQDGRQSFLVVIDGSGNYTELYSLLHDISVPYLKKGQEIVFIPAASSLGQQAINGKTPFYTKWKK
ncbi:MAG: enhanced serine sensitivity protein SseB C-terminal domain-containing protein [Eubacteriales bacterium]